jgi:hypothetical protein
MKYWFLLFFSSCVAANTIKAQDTLPRFSVNNVGNNRIIIGWINGLGAMRQISIQRSFDSIKSYKTILSVADPNAVQNGYADTKAPNDHMWYRIFYVLGNGSYYFTPAKRPDTSRMRSGEAKSVETVAPKKDSAVIKNPGFVPSFYVYTNNAGDVFINLPDADKKAYSLKFFDEGNTFLFDIKGIKETGLTLDKTNFHHAGWFWFELYSDDKLVERHKFYLARVVNFLK